METGKTYCPHCHCQVATHGVITNRCTNSGCGKRLNSKPAARVQKSRQLRLVYTRGEVVH